jgi:hypothetical protein
MKYGRIIEQPRSSREELKSGEINCLKQKLRTNDITDTKSPLNVTTNIVFAYIKS